MPHTVPAPALRALVAHLVDYAGLFPPAGLPMAEAVAEYAAYREAPEHWMLGRFVVPASRLDELVQASAALEITSPWHLAVLAGADVSDAMHAVRALNAAQRGRLVADVVEAKATTVDGIASAARAVGPDATLYVELPHTAEPRELLAAVKVAGARAKVRTGGLTADAFPTAAQLARFIARCAEAGVAFKATAGLHHPVRAEHRLTYEADAPHGTMFGFLNVFAAAAFAREGMPATHLADLLEERDALALAFGDDGLRWHGHAVSLARLAEARASFAIAFGSCSFREPVDDLHQLALL